MHLSSMALALFTLALWTLFVSLLINSVVEDEIPESDIVKNLPGQPAVNFNHYAGYIKLKPDKEKALFYWFFEAEDDPSSKPIVLWLNGGINEGLGCSSIAFGAAQEIGPFLIDQEEHIKFNKFSWNKVANIIFLDSPIGVGFSYTNNFKDLSELGDEVSAFDNYNFLVGWFKKFTNFKSNEFYIVGEGCGGHYAPQLADLIYERNKRGPYINLKGLMMGNAMINTVTDAKGIYDYAWSHGIISTQVWDGIKRHCNFSKKRHTKECKVNMVKFLECYTNIDILNIYSPLCLEDKDYEIPNSSRLVDASHGVSQHVLWNTLTSSGYNYCLDDHVRKYFNKKNVQSAIHANVTNLPYPFTVCSGDYDGRVPILSTKYSLEELKLNVTKEWRAWFEGVEVAGWVEEYEGGLTFASVRGAGHQVPISAPQPALSLFSHFLSSQPLPSSRF